MSTDIRSFAKAEQKKNQQQEFSILKPDGNKTMRVLKTHIRERPRGRHVYILKRVTAVRLSPSLKGKLNISSLADLPTNSQTQHAGKK